MKASYIVKMRFVVHYFHLVLAECMFVVSVDINVLLHLCYSYGSYKQKHEHSSYEYRCKCFEEVAYAVVNLIFHFQGLIKI